MKTPHLHIDMERMQALLDGDLSPADAADVRASIEGCARCSAEFEAWQLLFEDLGDLPTLEPSPAFHERVMESVPTASPGLLGSRIRSRAGARAANAHVDPSTLQDYLDRRLAARNIARVDRHLDRCAVCRSELDEYRAVARAIESLPQLAPSPEFGERVMAEVRVNQIAAVAMAPTNTSGRVLDWVRKRLPSSRQGWAAALGVSIVPVFTLMLMVRAVFSHELVTFGNLATFVRLQTSGLVATGNQALAAFAEQWVPAVLLDGAAMVGASPTLLAASAAVASVAMMASAWVLYRNLFSTPYDELSDARLSF